MTRQPVALVVDDEPTLRLLMCQALRAAGFTVEEAENGRTALDLFPCLRPDVVLVDVLMPGIDGIEVCRQIRAMPGGASLPILVISGMSAAELRPRALAAGATDILGKPLLFSALGKSLRDLVDVTPDAPPAP